MTANFPIYLLVMAGVTYLIRMLPLTIFRKEIKSTFVKSFLHYVPFAVLGAMTIPDVLYSTGDMRTAAVGLVVAVFLAWKGKSLLTVALAACAAVLAALVWLLVWYIEQRVLAKALGRVPEGADAQAAWEQHVLRKQGWTADSEQGRAALARVRAGVAAMREQPHEDVFTLSLIHI